MKNSKFSLLEHTADIGIKIQGNNLEELFESGFYGVLSIVAKRRPLESDSKVVELTSPDKESMLVDFLNEILYLINGENWLPAKIVKLNIDENNLKSVISGEKFSSTDIIKTEIKAATYHNINIKKNVDTWETNVVFDL